MFHPKSLAHRVFSACAEVVPPKMGVWGVWRVFSACAEVVPQACVGEGDNLSILRVRGGSSRALSCVHGL